MINEKHFFFRFVIRLSLSLAPSTKTQKYFWSPLIVENVWKLIHCFWLLMDYCGEWNPNKRPSFFSSVQQLERNAMEKIQKKIIFFFLLWMNADWWHCVCSSHYRHKLIYDMFFENALNYVHILQIRKEKKNGNLVCHSVKMNHNNFFSFSVFNFPKFRIKCTGIPYNFCHNRSQLFILLWKSEHTLALSNLFGSVFFFRSLCTV